MTALEHVARDLRYSWRSLRRDRVFTGTVIGTLAVALGLVSAAFTVFNAYVLRPYAVRDPYSLYEVRWRSREAGGRGFRWQDYEELRGRTDLFQSVIAERHRYVTAGGQRLVAAFVSGNYFESLGGRVVLGRPLASVDAPAPGGNPVAVLSDQGWSRLFDRDPLVFGREVRLNGYPVTVVGVMQPEFSGVNDTPPELWLPLTLHAPILKEDLFGPNQPREIAVIARLRRDVTPEHARQALTPFMARAVERADGVTPQLLLQATPAPLTLELLAVLSPVFAAFALVLLAACANVSNIMLARAAARHREIGVRLAIGASQTRIVMALLSEGVLLSLLAAACGLALAAALVRVGVATFFRALPPTAAALARVLPLDFDYRVFVFALVTAGLTTVLFALLPARQSSRIGLTGALRGELALGVRGSKLRGLLVAGQVAIALVLSTASAILVRNSAATASPDLGYDTRDLVSINQRTPGNTLIGRAAPALAEDPRVQRVAVTSRNPLFGDLPKSPVRTSDSQVVATSYMFVSPEYFQLLGVRLVRGRGFLPGEAQTEANVGIVSAAAARKLWPGADPLGKTIRVSLVAEGDAGVITSDARADAAARLQVPITVIGVADDVVSGFIYTGKDPAHLYMPTSPGAAHANALLLRGQPGLQPHMLQPLFDRLHGDPLAFEAVTLDEMLAIQQFPLRVASWIGMLLSGIALALSVSGLYGVVVYTLSQRRKEIGIRVALGATSRAVVRLLMNQCGRVAVTGACVGLLAAVSVLAALRSVIRFENVSILDPAAIAASVALVMASAAVATYLPARRAARIDPVETLRADG